MTFYEWIRRCLFWDMERVAAGVDVLKKLFGKDEE